MVGENTFIGVLETGDRGYACQAFGPDPRSNHAIRLCSETDNDTPRDMGAPPSHLYIPVSQGETSERSMLAVSRQEMLSL